MILIEVRSSNSKIQLNSKFCGRGLKKNPNKPIDWSRPLNVIDWLICLGPAPSEVGVEAEQPNAEAPPSHRQTPPNPPEDLRRKSGQVIFFFFCEIGTLNLNGRAFLRLLKFNQIFLITPFL